MSVFSGLKGIGKTLRFPVITPYRVGESRLAGGNYSTAFNLNECRRALMASDLDKIMPGWCIESEPMCTPTALFHRLVNKFVHNMFPGDTLFSITDGADQDLLDRIIEQTKYAEVIDEIVREACWMDWTGVRLSYLEDFEEWAIEVIPREYLKFTYDAQANNKIVIVDYTWPTETPDGKMIWNKERWTANNYYRWEPKTVSTGGEFNLPDFPKQYATVEENTYGEIPIHQVYHQYARKGGGVGCISKIECLNAKRMLRLQNKRHFSHLENMKPTTVIVDAKANNYSRAPGSIWEIESTGDGNQADAKLLEMANMPESVKDELYDIVVESYDKNGLTAPTYDEYFKTANAESGSAMRIVNQDDAKTIETFRSRGYSQILRILEAMLRMGARMQREGYDAVDPDDKNTWLVEAKFAEFFPLGSADKQIEQQIIQASKLPAETKAEQEAQLLGIDDPKIVAEMKKLYEEDAAMENDLAKATLKAANQPKPGGKPK